MLRRLERSLLENKWCVNATYIWQLANEKPHVIELCLSFAFGHCYTFFELKIYDISNKVNYYFIFMRLGGGVSGHKPIASLLVRPG